MTAPRLDEGSEREALTEAQIEELYTLACRDWNNATGEYPSVGVFLARRIFAALSTGRLGGEALVINATQLRSALEFVAPDFDTDEDQREQEVVIQRLPARTSTDGEPMEAGLYCWLAEYPEEGCIPLHEDEAFPAPAAQPQGDGNDR